MKFHLRRIFSFQKDLFHKKLPNSPLGNYLHGFSELFRYEKWNMNKKSSEGSDFNSACEFLKTYFLKVRNHNVLDWKVINFPAKIQEGQRQEDLFPLHVCHWHSKRRIRLQSDVWYRPSEESQQQRNTVKWSIDMLDRYTSLHSIHLSTATQVLNMLIRWLSLNH